MYGPTVIQLPGYTCDLITNELTWRQIQEYVRHNITADVINKTARTCTRAQGRDKRTLGCYCYITYTLLLGKYAIMPGIRANFINNLGDTNISNGHSEYIIIIGTTTLCGSWLALKIFSNHPVLVLLFSTYPHPNSSEPFPHHSFISFLLYGSLFSLSVLQALFFL